LSDAHSLKALLDRCDAAEAEFLSLVEEAGSSSLVQEVERKFLGKGGVVSMLSREITELDAEGKREFGRRIGSLRKLIEGLAGERQRALRQLETERSEIEEKIDLSEFLFRLKTPRLGSLHLVTQAREELEDIFLGMGYVVAEGPEVETEWHNFEALNIPKFHPARDGQDSFFIDAPEGKDGALLLRTHTSPMQIRLMQTQELPIYAVIPGKVFRRDTPDARHTPNFHQIEGLVVDKGITMAHLSATVSTFTKAYFGSNFESRLRPAYFPFTEPSAEFEITCAICLGSGCRTCSSTGWIELGGCGMVHPNVFHSVGVDPEIYSGFAFGFGIDRLVQMKHAIEDMRVFLENDVRFLSQFKGVQ
jgi:phenylalanyl-tRNA synthetase alpha chain